MIREEANRLADKILHSFQRGAITLDVWAEVLQELHYGRAEAALCKLRDTTEHMPSISTFRAAYRAELGTVREGHSVQCLCGGSGWILITETDNHGSWEAWAHCPKGPHTSFVEPDEPYDAVAGAAAYETYQALAATAVTRSDLAEACFAAAAAYRNAARSMT